MQSGHDQTEAARSGIREFPGSRLLLLIVAGHLPFALIYLRSLMGLSHYDFVPFAIVAFAVLVNRADGQRIRWSWVSTLLVLIDIALVVAGTVLLSPWLVWVGLVFGVAAVCVAGRECGYRRSLLFAVLPLVALIRPPFSGDTVLIARLQEWSTTIGSALLHRLHVWHYRSGNTLTLADKELFVEEACSGIQSFFTVVFIGLLVVAWNRRGIMHTIVLLTLAAANAIVLNVVRITGIAIAWHHWRLDLSTGVAHTWWGLACLLLAVSAIFSADHLVNVLFAAIHDSQSRSRKVQRFISRWNWMFAAASPIPEGSRTRAVIHPPHPAMVGAAAVLAVVLLSQCWMLFGTETATDEPAAATTRVEAIVG